jgi:protein-disulfide isomerase
MTASRLITVLAAASLSALTACSSPEGGPHARAARTNESSPAGGDSTVVAEVNGVAITRAELDEEAAAQLARLRQEEYQIRSRVLEFLIAERLVEAEARKRGVSTEELLSQEVERSLPKPSADQLANIYERNQARFAGQTREQAYARIAELLQERSVAEARQGFERTLRDQAEVTVHLDPPRVALDIPDDALGTGPKNAPVTIVEFTDYQCPYCHRAQEVVDQILERYQDKVRLVHLDFPLDNHPGAVPAARAARCAGEQDRFWDYHRSLMTDTGSLDQADLVRRAATLKLDSGDFAECLASDRHDEAIRAELEHGSSVGVTGTPAYFINGRMVSGAQPFPTFAAIIDAELAGD